MMLGNVHQIAISYSIRLANKVVQDQSHGNTFSQKLTFRSKLFNTAIQSNSYIEKTFIIKSKIIRFPKCY